MGRRSAWLVAAWLLAGAFGGHAPSNHTAWGADGVVVPRVPWTGSRVQGYPDPLPPYRTVRVYEKLPLFQPVYVRAEPGTQRMFLVDHKGDWAGPGGIRVFEDRTDVASSEPLLQMDRMIYGFCFHPKYHENGFLFVMSNGPVKAQNKQNRISRFTVDRQSPHKIVEGSELVILEFDSNGHNGGDLAFGPDGYLYFPTGDGTSDSDTLVTGQGLEDLLAVLVRIDVDQPPPGKTYGIPPDNPFINVPGARPEIWAYGFRNPWRVDYDHKLNQLWVAQNGQDLWEQAYLVRKGENYGWSVQEGSHPFYLERKRGPQPITPPTVEHSHSEARSLTGGVVYWGQQLPDLQGAYVYGDFSTGKIWGVKHDGTKVTFHQELADTVHQLVGFANGRDGSLLVVDHAGGLYRLEKRPTEPPSNFPRKLSETGLFRSVAQQEPAPGVVPYAVNAELWSDGAHKQRWLAIPPDKRIEYTSSRGWKFPDGSVLVKSFALETMVGKPESRKWIETRLLVKQEGEWVGYSYQWNDEQTDAVLVGGTGADAAYAIQDAEAPGGRRSQTWHYPSRAECMVCHSRAANYALGLTENQMNREQDYDGTRRNQLEWLEERGYFEKPLPKRPAELTKLVNPYDPQASLNERALSYLHANCSNCHVGAGGGNAAFEMEISAKPAKAKLYDANPVHTTFGIADAKVIATGKPDKSLLLYRIARRGHGQMPPLGTNVVDQRGVELVRTWIAQLKPVPPEPDEAAAAEATPPQEQFLRFVKNQAVSLRSADAPPESLAAWNQQRARLRRELEAAWGGFPSEPCPLEARQVGVLARDGYRVEKILLQTRPQVWMTANLYVPDAPGKHPAVLGVHGHWRGAKQDPVVQARCIGLVKHGFVVLAVDAFGAGERGIGEALGEYHGDMTGATLFPIGLPLSGLQVYENMRAVDYLRTRPEVDGERIGITGASGGGNQSMYAGAFDERFGAVVPVCSVGNYQAYLGIACCMCEVVPGALRFTEESGVLALTAPRGLMVVNATRDGPQFSVEAARISLAGARPVFQLFDREKHLRHAIFESPHDYNQAMREAMYGWMKLHLAKTGDGSPLPDPPIKTEDPESLRCFPGDSRPDDFVTIPRFAAQEGRRLLERQVWPQALAEAETWAKNKRRTLTTKVLGGEPQRNPLQAKVLEKGDASRTLSWHPEAGLVLTAQQESPSSGRLAIVLDLEGAARASQSPAAEALRKQGWSVLTVDLRATGKLANPKERIGRAPDHNTAEWAMWIGRPLLGQWVVDLRRTLDALEALDGHLPKEIAVVGLGPAGIVAVTAAAVEPRIQRVALVESLASYVTDVPYENQRLGIMAPGIVPEVGDVATLAALVAPRRVVVAGGVLGNGSQLTVTDLGKLHQQSARVFAAHSAANQFRLVAPAEVVAALSQND